MNLTPRYTASATLAGGTGGALVFGAVPSLGVEALLAPFFVGDPGPAGADSTVPGPQGPQGEPGSALINDELSPGEEGADAAAWSIDKTNTAIKRVRYDAAQALTSEQQLQACMNLGIGNPNFDFLTYYQEL
jgi:hypothetical protein